MAGISEFHPETSDRPVPLLRTQIDGDHCGAFFRSLLKGGLEDEIRGAPPDVRERCRQERSRPQIEDLRVAIDNALRRLSPKSAMAQALAYGRRRWEALTRFLDEGTAEIDNNIAER